MHWMGDIYKKVNAAIANFKQRKSSITKNDLALYIYDALRFYWPNISDAYPPQKFFMALEKIMKENNIECKICFTTSKYGARRDQVVEADDLTTFLSANNDKQLFFFPIGFRYAGEIPSAFQGENASAVSVMKYTRSSSKIEGSRSEFKIPNTSFEENKSIVKSEIAFSEGNPLVLKIKRTTTSSGEMKNDYLRPFALYEDWDKIMRKRLLIETDFWQDIESDKNDRKNIDRYKTFFEDKRKEQKESMESEFKSYHSTNSGELLNYSIKSIGTTIKEPDFEFETEYTIDGLVKKAGNNLILDAGKLIGTQWILVEKERERAWDAYLPAPILIENEISIDIPINYTVEGIENLNKNIDNEYGKFTSSATVEGNKLKIRTTKAYKKSFVPRNDWNILLKMIDTTNEFYSQSVMLKNEK